MKSKSQLSIMIPVLFSILLTMGTANAQPMVDCLPHSAHPTIKPGASNLGNSSIAYQQFPATGPMETAWYITFDHQLAKALFLTSAYFKPGPNRNWIQVLGRAGLSNIFVPYQSGEPRFLDLSISDFDLVTATSKDTGPCGRVVGRDDKVVREVVDKGPLWKNDKEVVRGQKMLLWGTLDAFNYNYIVRYEFHDDGTIGFRIAGTALNLPVAPKEPHTHNALWRIDINLDGAGGDSANVLRHVEQIGSLTWRNTVESFNNGREGALNILPVEFTQLQVVDAGLNNGHGKQSAYDFRPLYRGLVRHAEPFMRNDFWITLNRAVEQHFPHLPNYANDEDVRNADIVVWHVTSLLHVPRTEDGVDSGGNWKGVALAMWTGFDMRPRDLFDGTPFYR